MMTTPPGLKRKHLSAFTVFPKTTGSTPDKEEKKIQPPDLPIEPPEKRQMLEKNLPRIIQVQKRVLTLNEHLSAREEAEYESRVAQHHFDRLDILFQFHITCMELQYSRLDPMEKSHEDQRLSILAAIQAAFKVFSADRDRHVKHRIEMLDWRYQFGAFESTIEDQHRYDKFRSLALPKNLSMGQCFDRLIEHISAVEAEHIQWLQSRTLLLENTMDIMGTPLIEPQGHDMIKRKILAKIRRAKQREQKAQQTAEATQKKLDELHQLQKTLENSKSRREEYERLNSQKCAELDAMMKDV